MREANADTASGTEFMEQAGYFLSRRKLLVGLGAVATTAAALITPLRTAVETTARNLVRNQPAMRRMLLSLADAGYDEWVDQIGSIFTLAGGTSLKLIAVSPLNSAGTRPAGVGRASAFVAKFDVQNGGSLPGDLIYAASHPSYGAFRIFMSTPTDPKLRHRMTAVFN
jgi:hypothetical protein